MELVVPYCPNTELRSSLSGVSLLLRFDFLMKFIVRAESGDSEGSLSYLL